MWHCPHCGAPQAETARCWVCRKSSTTCSTCRHFRASLATDIGYCALDRGRRPLTGRELRGCWTQRPAATEPGTAGVVPDTNPGAAQPRPPTPLRGFIPLEDIVALAAPIEMADTPPMALLADGFEPIESRTSLFGELDR